MQNAAEVIEEGIKLIVLNAAKQDAKQVAIESGKQVAKEVTKQVATKTVVVQGTKTAGVIVAQSSSGVLTAIPFVGAGICAVSGIYEFYQGNIESGLIDMAQAGLNLIPGFGMGLSIGTAIIGGIAKAVVKYLDEEEERSRN